MKKVALVFILAVLAPSLVLAWLAIRSVRDQQLVLERQESLLCQGMADALARNSASVILQREQEFAAQVEALLARENAERAASEFDSYIRTNWRSAQVGFAVTLDGTIFSPSLFERGESRRFRLQNDKFLCAREPVEIWYNNSVGNAAQGGLAQNSGSSQQAYANQKVQKRIVVPQSDPVEDGQGDSKVMTGEADFRQLATANRDGLVARFLENKLSVLVWHRCERDPKLVFGADLNLGIVTEDLVKQFAAPGVVDEALDREFAVALLNDAGHPIVQTHRGFTTDWKHPFVAAEIGETLPHWEVAVAWLDPTQLTHTARTVRITVGLLITVLVVAIAVGGWLIFFDLKRQLELARQKTDFVSNVSHELKTPLTSIRMFSELLAEGRVAEPEKQKRYLGIISTETARLGRLINNVLDFARLDRGEMRYEFKAFDLDQLTAETVSAYRPQLEAAGFTVQSTGPSERLPVRGDRDAVAQVLVNLLSNAEKYSFEKKSIEINCARSSDGTWAEICVLDRGAGIPTGCEEKIFQQFFRAHNSLNSGIRGSGLGLTLARQISRAHGGEVRYNPRTDGGSIFTIRLPLTPTPGTSL